MSRAQHPAGRGLVRVEVTWVDHHALVLLANGRGRTESFRIVGPEQGNRRAVVRGNDRLALVYDVPPGSRLIIEQENGSILYDGTAPEA